MGWRRRATRKAGQPFIPDRAELDAANKPKRDAAAASKKGSKGRRK